MSETKYISENRHERLSEKVSRISKELSEVKLRIQEILSYLSPQMQEALPDLGIEKEQKTVHIQVPYKKS